MQHWRKRESESMHEHISADLMITNSVTELQSRPSATGKTTTVCLSALAAGGMSRKIVCLGLNTNHRWNCHPNPAHCWLRNMYVYRYWIHLLNDYTVSGQTSFWRCYFYFNDDESSLLKSVHVTIDPCNPK